MLSRTCTKCLEVKALDQFYRDKRGKYGRMAECKQCYEVGRKIYRNKNKDEISKKNRERYRKRMEDDPESERNRRRNWVKRNPDKKSANNSRYRKKHPESNIKHKHIRRAREAGVPTENLPTKKELLKKQGDMCANCNISGEDIIWHLDHIIPISKGGGNVLSNVQILCATCNFRKHDKMPDEWERENGKLL